LGGELTFEHVLRELRAHNILQHTAAHCNALQYAAPQNIYLRELRDFSVIHRLQQLALQLLQHTATRCNTLQHTTPQNVYLRELCNSSVFKPLVATGIAVAATRCNTLQHTAAHCNTLQHTAARCNTLQHTASQNVYLRELCDFSVFEPLIATGITVAAPRHKSLGREC